jgi:D-lyxose ketol-isomerase
MNESDRDILIEMRADMKHVRDQIEHFRASDTKQWEKLDAHSQEIEGQKRDINILTWAYRATIGGIITGIVGLFFYMRH